MNLYVCESRLTGIDGRRRSRVYIMAPTMHDAARRYMDAGCDFGNEPKHVRRASFIEERLAECLTNTTSKTPHFLT